MNTRRSKSVRFFCKPEELVEIVVKAGSSSEFRICRAEERKSRWYFQEVRIADIDMHCAPLFLYPAHLDQGDGLRSRANIVNVWFPVRTDGDLRMGEVGLLIGESDLSDSMRKAQGRVFRELRAELAGRLKRGAWARNTNTGGQSYYEDIYISGGVEAAARSGLTHRSRRCRQAAPQPHA